MAVSKAQIQATAKYEAKAYDKTLIRLPKGRLDEIRAHIEPAGESLNGFIGRAITEAMERDRGGGVAGRDAPQEAAGAAQGGRADVVNRDGGAGGPQEAAPTAGGVLLLPPDVLEDIRLMAEAEGEDIPSYVSRAVRAYAMQDGVEDDQEAAGAAQGGGGIPVPPDVLVAAGRAAEAAGEAVEDYVARVIMEAVARGRGGNASVSPVQAAGGPQRAGTVSYPSETQKPIQWAAEFTQEAIDRAIADNIDYVRARLNQGEAMARSKGRSKVSAYAKSVMRDIFEYGYSVEELRSAAEKAAHDGYRGSWYGLMDYCKNLYGRRYKRR